MPILILHIDSMNMFFAILILITTLSFFAHCGIFNLSPLFLRGSTLIFFVTGMFAASAQQILPEPSAPNRFIDKVELIGGLGIYLPDDNGWYDRLERESNGSIIGTFKSKVGFITGFGITHSFEDHLEINGRITWDRKGYVQENVTTGDNNNVYKFEANAQNDYLTGLIAPNIFISKKRKLYLSPGIFYSHLLKSLIQETSYLNNQITQQSSITNSPEINEDDFGILFAIGYCFPINSKCIIDLRSQFNYGLTDIINVNGLVLNTNSLNLIFTLKYNR